MALVRSAKDPEITKHTINSVLNHEPDVMCSTIRFWKPEACIVPWYTDSILFFRRESLLSIDTESIINWAEFGSEMESKSHSNVLNQM